MSKKSIMIQKYLDMNIQAKAAIWFTLCNLLLKGISLITVPMFTWLLSEEEYGLLSIYMSYEQLILIFATWEIQMGAYQKGIFKYKENIGKFTTATQLLTNFITCLFFSVVFVFQVLVTKITKMNPALLVTLFVYMLVQPAYNCWLIRRRTEYNYQKAVFATITYSLGNVLVPMFAIIVFDRTANIKYLSGLIFSIIFCCFFYFSNANYISLKDNWEAVKEQWLFLVRFEGPLVFHSLSYLILSQADRVMIGEMVGKRQAAFYSVAYSLASVVSILQTSINQTLLPWRYQMLEANEHEKIKDVTNKLLILLAVLVLMFSLVVPDVVKIFFSKNYYEAVWSIPPIASSVYFMFLYTIFVNIESYYENTKYIMYVSSACAIINIILNYYGILQFDYIACGYTTLISYLLFSLGHYFFMDKVLKDNFKGARDVIDVKFVSFISMIVVVATIAVAVIYKYNIIRYLCFCCMIATAVVYRKKLILLFSELKS